MRTCALFLLLAFAPPALWAAERPNILWITAEDMSPTLGCYGDTYATTPHIDALARQSVRYTHAFATAPVCSPSRSCLITGCYAPSLGTHPMRSAFPLPDFIRGFPAYLRQAGYYTSNNVKTDYNTGSSARLIAESWDESSPTAHWRKRSATQQQQPFFCVFNLMTSHQSRSMVWPYQQFQEEVQSRLAPSSIHDPATAPLPPYYPDTPVIRKTIARFYDCVAVMDQEVGALLQQLKEDGLDDNTIVFFYSDHGSGMPRHKRALLDSGMRVPLLIRFPDKFRSLAPTEPGDSTDRIVSFVDFAPTVLRLAGVKVPEHMQGAPFLAAEDTPHRRFALGHRDRIDEVIDLSRSIRNDRYLYIRNYMPHLGYNQPSAWPEQGEIRGEFEGLVDPKRMTAAQWSFVRPTRDVEELYDCQRDPHNLHNLATSPDHRTTLQALRKQLHQHLRTSGDLGFIPEIEMLSWRQTTTPWEAAREDHFQAAHAALAAADTSLSPTTSAQRLVQLQSDAAIDRYWAALGGMREAELSAEVKKQLHVLLTDANLAVRIAAAEALCRQGEHEAALPVLIELLHNEELTIVLHAARAIELQGAAAKQAIPAMRQALAHAEELQSPTSTATEAQRDLAMFVGFSTQAFLKRQ